MLCLAGCGSAGDDTGGPAASGAPTAAAICDAAAALWDSATETCSLVLANAKNAPTTITATYPVKLVEHPTAGPVLARFLTEFFDRHRRPLDDNATEDSVVTLTYTMFDHQPVTDPQPPTTSVLFRDYSYLAGSPHPNTTLTSFTFDLADGTPLTLADLLCHGVDPDTALPPVIRPHLMQEIERLKATTPPGTAALEVDQFEPVAPGAAPHDTFVTGYRAWVLDGDQLKFFLPDERTGPVGAGVLTPRVPLAELNSARGGNCTA